MMETIKMGKRGTVVIPAKLRKQFGLDDGSLLVTEAKDGEIRLRPASVYEPEVWSPEQQAVLLLNNVLTREEWDEIAADVRSWGLDPLRLAGVNPDRRETLLTDAQWDNRAASRRAELIGTGQSGG